MRCLIVEDEQPASERLKKLVESLSDDIRVAAITDSIKSTVEYLHAHPTPDFMLMDIQLGDGISFEILELAQVKCPIIFTTAFNEYAVKAFKVNSIDYLLKPIDIDELAMAIKKMKTHLEASQSNLGISPELIAQAMRMLTGGYKERFITKVGEKLHMLPVGNIAAFVSMEKSSFAYTNEGKMVGIDHTLDQIEELVDPRKFFRISRKHIVNIDSIADVLMFSSSRLKLRIANVKDDEVIVSREKCSKFKEWIDR